jgi:hypothetical protein
MKPLAVALFCFWSILVLSIPATPEESCDYCRSTWHDKPELRILCLIGAASLFPEEGGSEEAISCEIDEWRNNEICCAKIVSDAFVELLQSSPQSFLNAMAQSSSVFDRWIKRVMILSFASDANGDAARARKLREVIAVVASARATRPQIPAMKDKLLQTLREDHSP